MNQRQQTVGTRENQQEEEAARATPHGGFRYLGKPVALAVLATLVAVLISACGNDSSTTIASQQTDAKPPTTERAYSGPKEVHDVWGDGVLFAGVAETAYYATLPEMVADSDLVIDGLVTDVASGGLSGPEGDQFLYYSVTIEPTNYLKGQGPEMLQVEAFVGGDILFRNRGSLTGSRVLAFVASQADDARSAGATELEISAHEGRYRFNNSQGVVVRSDVGAVQPYRQVDVDSLGIELRPYDELLATVSALARSATATN